MPVSPAVSSLGRFCNSYGAAYAIKPHPSGYVIVTIQGQSHMLQHLVANAFLPPRPSPLHVLDHLDGARDNNAASNLRWVERGAGGAHAYEDAAPRGGDKTPKRYPAVFGRPVGATEWTRYENAADAAAQCHLERERVNYCATHHARGATTQGMQFRFITLEEQSLPGEEWRTLDYARKRKPARAVLARRDDADWVRYDSAHALAEALHLDVKSVQTAARKRARAGGHEVQWAE